MVCRQATRNDFTTISDPTAEQKTAFPSTVHVLPPSYLNMDGLGVPRTGLANAAQTDQVPMPQAAEPPNMHERNKSL